MCRVRGPRERSPRIVCACVCFSGIEPVPPRVVDDQCTHCTVCPDNTRELFSGGRRAAVLDHWGTPLWGGLGRWRRGCAARHYDPRCRCCRNTLQAMPSLPPLSLVGCGGVGVGWRRAAAAGAGVLRGVRVCRGRALPALSLGRGCERHVPARVLTRRSPRANCCPCFPFAAACVSAAGGGRSWVCGAGCAGRAQSQTRARVRQPCSPLRTARPAPLPPGYC